MAQLKFCLPLVALLFAAPVEAASQLKNVDSPSPAATPAADLLIIKRNFKAAFQSLLSAAKAGDAKAMVKLANAYRFGIGVTADAASAQEWYSKAAQAGNQDALKLISRQNVSVAPTVKKVALPNESGVVSQKVDFQHLPDRPKGAPDWVLLAAAQKNRAALQALNGGQDAARFIQVQVGDAEGLKSNAEALTLQDDLGRSATMLALEADDSAVLGTVLATKPSLDVVDKRGLSAAGVAALSCDVDRLQTLATAGDDLKFGQLPPVVVAAAHCDDWNGLKGLFAKVDLNAHDAQGRTAATFAALRGNVSLLGWLADNGGNLAAADQDGFTPLHRAAQANQVDAFKFILSKVGGAESLTTRKVTPLMLAAHSGCLDCIAAAIALKPDLDQKDLDGDTALMFAVRALQAKAAQKLADSGANPNAKNGAGDTPMKLGVRLGMLADHSQN